MENKNEIENLEAQDVKERGYARGVITGVLATACVFLLLIAAGVFWLQGRVSLGNIGKASTDTLITNSVKSKLNQLMGMIEENYYEDVETEALQDGLYKGLLKSLDDPYSVYYTEEEYQNMLISTSAQYYGVGAVLQQDPDTMRVTITRVYENSPAQKAGLKADDVIIQVEDIVSTSMELSELVTYIRGEEDSLVHLKIYRQGESGYLDFEVKRGRVDIPTVQGEMLTDDIGYIMIAEFGNATAEDFEKEVETLQASGMEKMIIDLRDNPGGMLNSVCEILDFILPEGLIVYTEDKYGNRKEQNSDAERYLDCPIAVLINKNSASCSEVFAGAIRDYEYGTLIGTTTYGKGVVQAIQQLPDKSAVKLTVAKYYTPNGENIHGTGIDPDIELEYEYTGAEDEEYDYEKDNQVEKAIEILQ